jgi:hypothetical protein
MGPYFLIILLLFGVVHYRAVLSIITAGAVLLMVFGVVFIVETMQSAPPL